MDAECKVSRDSDRKSFAWTVEQGVRQTLGYMEKSRARARNSPIIAEQRPESTTLDLCAAPG